MSGKEISPNSPTGITLTKSTDGIKVTLTLELPSPKDMETALALPEEIKQNLRYSHPDFSVSSNPDNFPQHLHQADLPLSLRHRLFERAVEENCSMRTLYINVLTRFCERGV